jgi:hypothetical protein
LPKWFMHACTQFVCCIALHVIFGYWISYRPNYRWEKHPNHWGGIESSVPALGESGYGLRALLCLSSKI